MPPSIWSGRRENITSFLEDDGFLFIYCCVYQGAYHEQHFLVVLLYTTISVPYIERLYIYICRILLLCDIVWRPDGKRPIFYKFLTSWMAFPSNETDTPDCIHPYLFIFSGQDMKFFFIYIYYTLYLILCWWNTYGYIPCYTMCYCYKYMRFCKVKIYGGSNRDGSMIFIWKFWHILIMHYRRFAFKDYRIVVIVNQSIVFFSFRQILTFALPISENEYPSI